MPKHTPAPWQIRTGDPGRAAVVHETSNLASHVCRLDENWICDEHGGTVAANARLIAAAPDMLKVLQQLTDEAERGMEWISEDTIDSAVRAIAKATGASQ